MKSSNVDQGNSSYLEMMPPLESVELDLNKDIIEELNAPSILRLA